MQVKQFWPYLRGVLLLALMLGFGLWALQNLNPRQLWAELRAARWEYLALSTLLGVFTYMILSYRWRILLHRRPTYLDTFSAFQVGVYVNILLPLRAGDLARAYLIHRKAPDYSVLSVLSSIGAGLVLDMLAMASLMPLVLWVLPFPPAMRAASLALALLSLLIAGTLIPLARHDTWLSHQFYPWSRRYLAEARARALLQTLEQLRAGFAGLRDNRALAECLALTILAYGLQGLANWCLLLSLEPEAGLLGGYIAMVGAGIGLAVPLLPGSVGTYEAAITAALAATGISAEASLLASLLFRAQQTLIIMALGSVFLVREGLSLGELQTALAQQTLDPSPPILDPQS